MPVRAINIRDKRPIINGLNEAEKRINELEKQLKREKRRGIILFVVGLAIGLVSFAISR